MAARVVRNNRTFQRTVIDRNEEEVTLRQSDDAGVVKQHADVTVEDVPYVIQRAETVRRR